MGTGLVIAALLIAGGMTAAAWLHEVPIGACALVCALGWSLRRGWGLGVAYTVVGVLAGQLAADRGIQPNGCESFDTARLVVERLEPWRDRGDSWGAPARVRSAASRGCVDLRAREVWLSWPVAAPPPSARRLRIIGRIQAGSGPFNRSATPRARWFVRIRSPRLVEPWVPRSLPAVMLDRLRGALEERFPVAARGESRGRAVAGALLLGDAGRLSRETASALRRLGLAHLTAASGLHVGVIGAAAAALWSGCRRRWRVVGILAGIGLFVATVGARPSVLRAGVAAALVIGMRGSGRWLPAAPALAASAMLLLLAEPALLGSLGFRLSYSACAGIVALAGALRLLLERALRARKGSLRRLLAASLSLSIAAQLATAPLLIYEFGAISPAACLLNLVFVPWAMGMLITALLAAAGEWAGLPAYLVTTWLDLVASPLGWLDLLPRGPFWTLLVASGKASAPLGIVAGLLLLLRAGARRKSRWVGGALGLASSLWLLHLPAADEPAAALLDVGQGDAIVLRAGRRTVLVDGGGRFRGDTALSVLVPALAELGARRLDLAIVSHGDRDHCLGVVQLLDIVAIDRIWVGPGVGRTPCGRRLLLRARRRAVVVGQGRRAQVGSWRLRVVSAPDAATANASSVVVRAEAGAHSLLLTGDLDRVGERALVARSAPASLRSGILKVPHHGSRNSSSGPFLDRVGARVALLSAGRDNPYGHPAATVLERLRRRHALVLRTDLDGRVVLVLPEAGPVRVETARPRFASTAPPLRMAP